MRVSLSVAINYKLNRKFIVGGDRNVLKYSRGGGGRTHNLWLMKPASCLFSTPLNKKPIQSYCTDNLGKGLESL